MRPLRSYIYKNNSYQKYRPPNKNIFVFLLLCGFAIHNHRITN